MPAASTTPRKSAATRKAEAIATDAAKLAAQTGDTPAAGSTKPAQTAAQINAQQAAARLAATKAINGAGGTGRSVSGADEAKGRRPAAKPGAASTGKAPDTSTAKNPSAAKAGTAPKPTSARRPAKRKDSTTPGTELERTDLAAQPVRIRTSRSAKREGPTDTDLKRVVAARIVGSTAKMLSSWPEKTTGVTKTQAEEWAAKWLQYLPLREEDWPETMPARSGAGRRSKGSSSEAA